MASYSNDKDIHLQGSDYESPVLNGKNKEVSNGSQEGIDLDHRRRAALDEVDNASFNRYHVKAVLVACIGFLTDAYDIFAISMAATMIGYVYHKGGANTANQDLGIKVSHSIGTFCGQLLFGWLADVLGRKKMYGIELMIIIIGTIGTAIAGQGPTVSIYGVLIFWRFIMGLGIGGDYPLSAIITSEFASTKIRGRMMTAVFAGQGWGNLLAAIVAIITVTGFKHQIINDTEDFKHVDYCWRILLGFGCVPAAGALYFRLTIPETPRFTMDIERNVQQAAQDVETYLSSGQFSKDPDAGVQRAEMPKATRADFFRHYGQWKNGKILFGCAWSWFALDVAFYGLGLNSSTVLTTIGFGSPNKSLTGGAKVYQNLHNIAVGNIILSAAGLVPGYWATFLFIDKVGRKPIQLMGFVILTILFFVMGGAYHKLLATSSGTAGFTAMYCLCNFFQNFGPNTTTFIIPGEAGAPTRFRSTFHGISAASGKLGAIIAQVGFSRLKDRGGKNHGIPTIFLVFGAFMASGIASTLLLPETKGRSLEELSDEDQEGFVKGPVPTNFATHI